MEDKLSPSIYYLQKLGPEHLDEIFASSRWIFEKDSSMAFQVSCPNCALPESDHAVISRSSLPKTSSSLDQLLLTI
jgi:hypothetical protein